MAQLNDRSQWNGLCQPLAHSKLSVNASDWQYFSFHCHHRHHFCFMVPDRERAEIKIQVFCPCLSCCYMQLLHSTHSTKCPSMHSGYAPWYGARWETAFCALFSLLNGVNQPVALYFFWRFRSTPAMCTKVLNRTFELTNGIHFGTSEPFVLALCITANVPPQVPLSLNWLLASMGSYTFLIKYISFNNKHVSLSSSLVGVFRAPAMCQAPH